jgi:hypothetical protein
MKIMEEITMDNMKVMNPIVADFCALLESKNVSYELNDNDENMLRFQSKLPNHEVAPVVFIHYNPKNQALTLALSRMAHFSSVGVDLYQLLNQFNADPENFACKMFVDDAGEIVVLVNAVVAGDDPRDQIEDYLNTAILASDKYFGRISEVIENNNKN